MLAEIVNTLVLQSHTVEHSHRSFSHAWIIVTLTRLKRCTLHDNTSNTIKWNEIGKFKSISECARCCHHRILQMQIIYFYV